MTDQEAFERLKAGDKEALGWIFKTYRNPFAWWAMKKYTVESDDAVMLFEDAIIILVKNVQNGKLTSLSSTLNTYLIGVAINIKREEARKNKREMDELGKYVAELDTSENPFLTNDSQEVIKLVLALLKKMGQPCNEILTRFYLEEQSLEFIQKTMGFASTAVVKVQKARCLKDLMAQVLKVKQSIHNSMDSQCTILLKLYFIEKKSLEDIKTQMGYATVDAVNTQKDGCLKDLLDRLQ